MGKVQDNQMALPSRHLRGSEGYAKAPCCAKTSARAASYIRNCILIQLRALPYYKQSMHETLFSFLQHL